MGKITVIGMGPGDFGYLTMESWELMTGTENLILRTEKHPTADELKKRGIRFSSYDDFYEQAVDFETLYQKITSDLLTKARTEDRRGCSIRR